MNKWILGILLIGYLTCFSVIAQDESSSQQDPDEKPPQEVPAEEKYVDPFAPVDLSKYEVEEKNQNQRLNDLSKDNYAEGASATWTSGGQGEEVQSEKSVEERAAQVRKEIEENRVKEKENELRSRIQQSNRQDEVCRKSIDECMKEEALKRATEEPPPSSF